MSAENLMDWVKSLPNEEGAPKRKYSTWVQYRPHVLILMEKGYSPLQARDKMNEKLSLEEEELEKFYIVIRSWMATEKQKQKNKPS